MIQYPYMASNMLLTSGVQSLSGSSGNDTSQFDVSSITANSVITPQTAGLPVVNSSVLPIVTNIVALLAKILLQEQQGSPFQIGGATGSAGYTRTAAAKHVASDVQPANSVSVKDFGAIGDGKSDDSAAIQKAINAAKASGKSVWLPPGTYNHSGKITLDSISMSGAGEKSVLNATNPDSSAITLTGNNPSLSDIQSISQNATSRSSMPDAANILVQNATGATVSNMKIVGASSNGIRLDGSQNATISNNLCCGKVRVFP